MLNNISKCKVRTMQEVTLLVGVSCSGKSTYLKKQGPSFIVSSDIIVEEICAENKITYSQFFQLPMTHHTRKEQRNRFNNLVNESKNKPHVTWDLTNLTAFERKRAMSHYPIANFKAIVFEFKSFELKLIALNERRNSVSGKYVPESVLLNMFSKFENISKNEGFNEIKYVNQIVNIPIAYKFPKVKNTSNSPIINIKSKEKNMITTKGITTSPFDSNYHFARCEGSNRMGNFVHHCADVWNVISVNGFDFLAIYQTNFNENYSYLELSLDGGSDAFLIEIDGITESDFDNFTKVEEKNIVKGLQEYYSGIKSIDCVYIIWNTLKENMINADNHFEEIKPSDDLEHYIEDKNTGLLELK